MRQNGSSSNGARWAMLALSCIVTIGFLTHRYSPNPDPESLQRKRLDEWEAPSQGEPVRRANPPFSSSSFSSPNRVDATASVPPGDPTPQTVRVSAAPLLTNVEESAMNDGDRRVDPLAWPPLTSQEFADGKETVFEDTLDQQNTLCSTDRSAKNLRGNKEDLSSNPHVQVIGLESSFEMKTGRWHRFWLRPTLPDDRTGESSSRANVGPPLPVGRRAQCEGGDVFQLVLESTNSKIDINERIYDLGNGLHEVHLFVRRPGSYRLCVDVVRSAAVFVAPSDGISFEVKKFLQFPLTTANSETVEGRHLFSGDDRSQFVDSIGLPVDLSPYCRPRDGPTEAGTGQPKRFQFTQDEYCMGTTQLDSVVFAGDPLLPRPIRCDKLFAQQGALGLEQRNALRSGAWIRLPGGVCDGLYCVGDLTTVSPANSDGWFFALDACTLVVHEPPNASSTFPHFPTFSSGFGPLRPTLSQTPTATAKILSNSAFGLQWILGWGDSTLKQPLANWVEYALKEPVFALFEDAGDPLPAYMEDLPNLEPKIRSRGIKRKKVHRYAPNFFSYRQWDVNMWRRRNSTSLPGATEVQLPFRLTFDWGGCANIGAAPSACPGGSGLQNRGKVGEQLREHLSVQTEGEPAFPSLILLGHFHWRSPRFDESSFLSVLNDTLAQFLIPLKKEAEEKYRSTSGFVKPLIVWHTPTTRVHNSDMRASCELPSDFQVERHTTQAVEEFLVKNFPDDVIVLSRHRITAPLRFGDRFGHFGVHYGAGRGMCYTGNSKGYDPATCERDTIADDMLPVLWMNLLAGMRMQGPTSGT